MAERHPIFRMVRDDGRSLAWLARRTGYSPEYVRGVACGRDACTANFRARCAAALGLPASELFHDADDSNAPPSADEAEPGLDRRDGTAGGPESYAIREGAVVSISA